MMTKPAREDDEPRRGTRSSTRPTATRSGAGSSGRKAKFVEYGGYHRARELADAAGATLALWGSQYGQRGVPGDATPEVCSPASEDAIERGEQHD